MGWKDDDKAEVDAFGNAAAGSASAGGASGSSGAVGASSGTQESTSKAFEGSIKQATDVNAEEVTAGLITAILAENLNQAKVLNTITSTVLSNLANLSNLQNLNATAVANGQNQNANVVNNQQNQDGQHNSNLTNKVAIGQYADSDNIAEVAFADTAIVKDGE